MKPGRKTPWGKSEAPSKKTIEDVLEKAKEPCLMEKLIGKRWKDDFDAPGFDKRVKIKLESPK